MPLATPHSVLVAEAVKGLVQRVNVLAQVDKALVSGVVLQDKSAVTADELKSALGAENVAKIEAVIAAYKATFDSE